MKNVRLLFWAMAICLSLSSIAMAADWTGIWVRTTGLESDSEFSISQNGQQINAVFTKPNATATGYLWKSGDQKFYGTISGQTMTGKIYVHFPVDYQTSCPSQWVSGFDLTLTMSSDEKTIEGQYVAGSLYSNCSIVMDTTPVTIKFTRKSQCFHVNDDLKINVTCAEYQGTKYKVNLNYVSGVLWKADTSTFGIGDSGNCISVANDLKLNMSCAEYKGNIYGFIMDFAPKTNDPFGLYWQIDTNTFTQK